MKNKTGIIFALLAATFYAISAPFSKLLLEKIPPTLLASLLYLGAGIGMSVVYFIKKIANKKDETQSLDKNDFKYVVGMIVLDILAPIFLMISLSITSAATVSLLNNFEIVATSLIALIIFKEKINRRLWIGIIMITLSVSLLSLNVESLEFNYGSFFAILACLCWGLENNCTKSISDKNPFQIVILKGIFSGLGSLIISFFASQYCSNAIYIFYALALGFIAYGLSVFTYVIAQRSLGAAKTSAYYAVAPFIGVFFSYLFFKEQPNYLFYIALIIMIIGTVFVSIPKKSEEVEL